jgi:hypothetical protein
VELRSIQPASRSTVVNVAINNPPAAMNVVETVRQVQRALVDELAGGGTTELRLAIDRRR